MSLRIGSQLAVLALLLPILGCSVDPLAAVGRPCSSTDPCPEGTYCHPTALVCLRGSGAIDAGQDALDNSDTFRQDGPLQNDAPPVDSQPDAIGDQSVDQPVIVDSQVDLGPLCPGVTCPLGCNASANRCNRLKPSTFDPSSFHAKLSKNLKLDKATVFNTETGEVKQGSNVLRTAGSSGAVVNGIYWALVSQSAGYPKIAVFATESLQVEKGDNVTVTGKNAFAYYAAKSITISGTLTASAVGNTAGGGGFSGGLKNGLAGQSCFGGQGLGGLHGGSGANQVEGGGGGGGHKAAGGAGADSNVTPFPKGGAGGTAVGKAQLVPLFGGCGGGAGGGPDTGSGSPGDGGAGGGGGGAIQLVANGAISISGAVSAAGAGGEGAYAGAGGGGGGSGGAILIEGLSVQVSGILAANGGGGGSGAAAFQQAKAPDGKDGTSSTSAAAGGPYNPPHGGTGGSGGALSKEAGGTGGTNGNGGGGGGAAGRIRINAPSVAISSQSTSPSASTNSTVTTW